jgi:putative SbcD/Mre11-related phosphoesterase
MDNIRVETVFNKLTQKLLCETLTKIQLVFPHPAILLKEKSCRALVVSDLHIGWEKLLSQKGIHIPSQTPKLKRQLLNLIEETKPKYLILLGDIKDAITNVSTQEWKEIPEFFETIQQEVSEIQIILGNHDGNLEHLLPEKIKIIPASGTIFGNVGLIHGHAWPAPELLRCKNLITGHVHPTVAIRDPMGLRITKQIFVKVPCNTQQLKKKSYQETTATRKTRLIIAYYNFLSYHHLTSFLEEDRLTKQKRRMKHSLDQYYVLDV